MFSSERLCHGRNCAYIVSSNNLRKSFGQPSGINLTDLKELQQQQYSRQMSFFLVCVFFFFPLINIFAWLIKFINKPISLLGK